MRLVELLTLQEKDIGSKCTPEVKLVLVLPAYPLTSCHIISVDIAGEAGVVYQLNGGELALMIFIVVVEGGDPKSPFRSKILATCDCDAASV